MSNDASNPLVDHLDLPQFDQISHQHVEPAVDQVLARAQEELERIEANIDPTWDGLLTPLESISLQLHHMWSPVSHLNGVANSEELREVYQKCQGKVVDFSLRFGQSKPIYNGLCAIRESSEWSKLAEGQQRIIDSHILSAKLSGIGLAADVQEEFNDLSKRLSELSTRFSNNVLDSTKDFKLVVDTPEKMAGMPESFLAQAHEAYRATEEVDSGGSAKSGPWLITLDLPSYVPFMENCRDRQLREQVYRAFITRASKGEWNNEEHIRTILALRKRQAKLLGYNSYAEVSLAKKMAPDLGAILHLEEELRSASWDPARKDLEELQQFARSLGHAGDLKGWDLPFWSKRLQEQKFDYTDEQLKPYFSLPSVLDGLFELVHRLFGVTVRAADGETSVWEENVRFFKIFDETDQHVASFFLDPYSRPKNKRGGAWMDECITRHKRNQKLTLPVAYLVCNSTPPVGDQPSLLTFREVETLFHEFGHGLQHMLTQVDHLDASGINNVEWDAVELPSQFMENWCYHRPTLMGFAKHYETGEPLPDDLFEKLTAARTYHAAFQMLRQIQFGLVDLELHDRFDPKGDESPFDVQRRIAEKTAVITPLPEDRMLCSFNHIFAGGYAAGYYSYKWAEVLSADAFSAFEEAGLDDPSAVAEVGRRFRKTVLAEGGSRHPMEVFKSFRGREPSTDALLRHSGLRLG